MQNELLRVWHTVVSDPGLAFAGLVGLGAVAVLVAGIYSIAIAPWVDLARRRLYLQRQLRKYRREAQASTNGHHPRPWAPPAKGPKGFEQRGGDDRAA